MTGRERFLTALKNGKPDRLPCQVHNWMKYYLDTYLKGMDAYEAYEYFDMDPVIYTETPFVYTDSARANWVEKIVVGNTDADGVTPFMKTIVTPKGELYVKGASNCYTSWETEHMIKDERDFELFREFYPRPVGVDWEPVRAIKRRIGDRGIVRGYLTVVGQLSPWQSLCASMGTEACIYKAFDEPEWMHYALGEFNKLYIEAVDKVDRIELDLVETGGGAASSTVISPAMHEEFCLPYDREYHAAIHEHGALIVNHLCGGMMPLLEMVATNGADALETMTPASMGADCILAEATRRVGDKLCFIGGFDQNAGFERGNPDKVYEMVMELHAACPDGGYICSPSDHFFFGDPENIKAFSRACKEARY